MKSYYYNLKNIGLFLIIMSAFNSSASSVFNSSVSSVEKSIDGSHQWNSSSERLDVYAYNYWGYEIIKNYYNEITTSAYAQPDATVMIQKCEKMYNKIISNGEMSINYSFGYFDDSQGINIIWNNADYGISPSLDIGMYNSFIKYMTENCDAQTERTLCGFKLSGNQSEGKVELFKEILLMGKNIKVKMILTQASASESFILNKNELQKRQKFLTLQSEENFFGAIGKSDIVFYNGHSRNGGGPDFNPPLLDKELHPNYDGYYRKEKPGIKRVLKEIKSNQYKDGVLGFFSCSSYNHFYEMIMKANPKQKLILSTETIDYFDTIKVSTGYLEALLRGYCGQELANFAKQGEKLQKGFQGFQLR